MKRMEKLLRFLALGLALALLAPALAMAQTSDMERLYTVSGIKVDKHSTTATRARTIALTEAQESAFRRLLRRLMADEDLDRFYMPEGTSPADYVLGFEVVEEARSRVRYIATLDITFDQEKIQQLLGSQQIAYVGIAPKPALVLPLMWEDGTWLLWEETNIFATLWADDISTNRITSYRFPEGTLKERAAITADQIIDGRGKKRLEEFTTAYGADDILAVSARVYRNTFNQTERMEIESWSPLTGIAGDRFTLYPGAQEDMQSFMVRGIDQLLNRRDTAWKRQAMTQFGEELELALVVPVTGVDGWAETLKRLETTTVVQDVVIIRMAMPESYLVVRFAGNTDQLTLALAQKGLILAETERGWVLMRQEEAGRVISNRGE